MILDSKTNSRECLTVYIFELNMFFILCIIFYKSFKKGFHILLKKFKIYDALLCLQMVIKRLLKQMTVLNLF